MVTPSVPAGTRPDPLGRVLLHLAGALAVLGGLVLVGLTLVSVASIAGRVVLSAPVPGDFEIVEMGTAVAVVCFLPYCQLVRGNVVVDFFTVGAGPRTKAALDLFGNLLFTILAGLLTWRLWFGLLDLRSYQESTMMLRIPVWWGFVPAVIGMGFLAVVCAYTAWRSGREFAAGVHPGRWGERE